MAYEVIDTIEDSDGDVIKVGADRHDGSVWLIAQGAVVFDAAGQERFAQAYVAACHQAAANAETAREEALDTALEAADTRGEGGV